MRNKSKVLTNLLSEFMVCELGSKAVDGVTYTLLIKNKKDNDTIKRYMEIKNEVVKCGYSEDELFRVYELANGYIFDLDINEAKKMVAQLVKKIAQMEQREIRPSILSNLPDKRRDKEMQALSKFILKKVNSGVYDMDVALFSRNNTNKINISSRDSEGKLLVVNYAAFALRHWDIQEVNQTYLMPKGVRISKLKSGGILPSKTGVSFSITAERI